MWEMINNRRVMTCDQCGAEIEASRPGYYGEDYVEVNGEHVHVDCMYYWIQEHRKELKGYDD